MDRESGELHEPAFIASRELGHIESKFDTQKPENRFDLAKAPLNEMAQKVVEKHGDIVYNSAFANIEEFQKIFFQLMYEIPAASPQHVKKLLLVLSKLDSAMHTMLTRREGHEGGDGILKALTTVSQHIEDALDRAEAVAMSDGDTMRGKLLFRESLYDTESSVFTLSSNVRNKHASIYNLINETNTLLHIYARMNFRALLHMDTLDHASALVGAQHQMNNELIRTFKALDMIDPEDVFGSAVDVATEELRKATPPPDREVGRMIAVAKARTYLHREIEQASDDIATVELEELGIEIIKHCSEDTLPEDIIVSASTDEEGKFGGITLEISCPSGFDLQKIPPFTTDDLRALDSKHPLVTEVAPTMMLSNNVNTHVQSDVQEFSLPRGIEWFKALGYDASSTEYDGVVVAVTLRAPLKNQKKFKGVNFERVVFPGKESSDVGLRNEGYTSVMERPTNPLGNYATNRLSPHAVWGKSEWGDNIPEFVVNAARYVEQKKPLALAVLWHNFIKSMRNRMPEPEARRNLIGGIIESSKNESLPPESLTNTLEPGQSVQTMCDQAVEYVSSTHDFMAFPWAKDYQGLPDQLEVAADQASVELSIAFNEVYGEYTVLERSIEQLLESHKGVLTDQEQKDFGTRFIYLKSETEVIYKTEPNVHQKIKELKTQFENMRGLGNEIVGLLRSRNGGENEIIRKVAELLNVEKAE